MPATGSPNGYNLNVGIIGSKPSRGLTKWNPFKDVITEKGQPCTATYETDSYLVGYQPRWFEDMYGGSVRRDILTVIEHKVKNEKRNNRTGPRKHHQAQTLNQTGSGLSSPATVSSKGQSGGVVRSLRRKRYTSTRMAVH